MSRHCSKFKWPESFKCPKCGSCHCTVVRGCRLPLYQCIRFYNALSKDYCCDMQKYNPKSGDGRLKWPHGMVSNIKANIEGAYHGLEGTYLQHYLDEFYYQFNRRHSKKPVFDHLLACCVWTPYKTVAELGI